MPSIVELIFDAEKDAKKVAKGSQNKTRKNSFVHINGESGRRLLSQLILMMRLVVLVPDDLSPLRTAKQLPTVRQLVGGGSQCCLSDLVLRGY